MIFWFRLPIRTRLGIVATLLLVVAAVSIALWTSDPGHHKPLSSVIRFAPILFLFWLSWTDLQRIPFWVWLVMPVVIIFCALKPALWFLVIPAALIALFVMPKKKRK